MDGNPESSRWQFSLKQKGSVEYEYRDAEYEKKREQGVRPMSRVSLMDHTLRSPGDREHDAHKLLRFPAKDRFMACCIAGLITLCRAAVFLFQFLFVSGGEAA